MFVKFHKIAIITKVYLFVRNRNSYMTQSIDIKYCIDVFYVPGQALI